jgi:hypothetical protein
MKRSFSICGQKYYLNANQISPVARIINGNTNENNIGVNNASNASGRYNY